MTTNHKTPFLLAVESIRIDGNTQSRTAINEDTVSQYAESMREGEVFPPVVVFFDGVDHWLADGFHRYHATRAAELEEIEVDELKGTRRDAILYAAGSNAKHGLRRTNADKRRAVMWLLEDEEWGQWSDREIARHCLVAHKTVGKLRKELTGEFPSENSTQRTFKTKHGTIATMKVSNIGRSPATPELKVAPDTSPSLLALPSSPTPTASTDLSPTNASPAPSPSTPSKRGQAQTLPVEPAPSSSPTPPTTPQDASLLRSVEDANKPHDTEEVVLSQREMRETLDSIPTPTSTSAFYTDPPSFADADFFDNDEDDELFEDYDSFDESGEPQLAHWSEEERRLYAQLQGGQTTPVHIENHRDIIKWAKHHGLYVPVERTTIWANPFMSGKDGTRDECTNHFEHNYLPYKPSLLNELPSLKGKALGCWSTEHCHAHVLAEWADAASPATNAGESDVTF